MARSESSQVLADVNGLPTSTDLGYAPRTELGKRLIELRRQIEASGLPLLTVNEINAGLRSDRGECEADLS